MSLDAGGVLWLRGELDLATVGSFAAGLDLFGMVPGLVLDLSELGFVSSTGLSELVRLHHRLVGEGRQLVVRRPQANVRHLLAVTGIDRIVRSQD